MIELIEQYYFVTLLFSDDIDVIDNHVVKAATDNAALKLAIQATQNPVKTLKQSKVVLIDPAIAPFNRSYDFSHTVDGVFIKGSVLSQNPSFLNELESLLRRYGTRSGYNLDTFRKA